MLHSWIKPIVNRYRTFVISPIVEAISQAPRVADPAVQSLLQLEYARLVQEGKPLPRIGDVGFKVYSQCDEDGILLFLFSVIGAKSKTCVEICAGDGSECNTANLIRNHGWYGLLVDADKNAVQAGKAPLCYVQGYVCLPPKVCLFLDNPQQCKHFA